MPDDFSLSAFVLLAALTLAFGYLLWRQRRLRTFFWFLGVSISGVQSLLRWLGVSATIAVGERYWYRAGAELALILSSSLFLLSLSPATFRLARTRMFLAIPYTAPVLLYVALYYGVSQHPQGALLSFYIFLAYWTAGAGLLWSLQKGVLPVWLACTVVTVAALLCMPFFALGNVYYPLVLVESGNMLMCGLLVLFRFRRVSPGVALSALGFGANALLFLPNLSGIARYPVLWTVLGRSAELGKVVVGLGLLLLVLEEELESSAANGRRERRLREEMDAYGRLPLGVRSLEEFDRCASQVCGQIAERSCFQGAAIAVRNGSGGYSVVGYAGMNGATAGALDNLMHRLPADCFSLPSSFSGGGQTLPGGSGERRGSGQRGGLREGGAAEMARAERLVVGSTSLSLDLRAWMMPGDDLERLCLTWVAAVPMPSLSLEGKENTEGALLLTAPRVPLAAIGANDLLPLEVLAGRLQAARTQAMLMGKLIDSERSASIGLLAGNVAQQLNNPLTVVLGYAALLEESTGAGAGLNPGPVSDRSAEHRAAEAVGIEARRMKSILARLSRFSRVQTEQFEEFAMADLLADIEHMHRTDFLRHSIEFRLTVESGLPPIFGSAHQIRQVLLHVTQYAIESVSRMGGNGEKWISIDAGSSGEDASVRIELTHSGPGLAHPERAFDSLASGFSPSEPAGIGLSLAATLVGEHRGSIAARNTGPTGAAITIELPIR